MADSERPFHDNRANPARCSRCSSECDAARLRRVPWILQLAAFPLTGLLIANEFLSVSTLHKMAASQPGPKHDYLDRYCPNCITRQVVYHIVVAIWAISFVAYGIAQWIVA